MRLLLLSNSRNHDSGYLDHAEEEVRDLFSGIGRILFVPFALKDLAVSSGSACTSASLEPSYVLRALGRNDELAHSSIRFTFGRFTTEEEVDYAAQKVRQAVAKLRELSPLWDMYKEGVDLTQVEWQSH